MKNKCFEEFFNAYLTCALWSSTDTKENGEMLEGLDQEYTIEDIDHDSIETMKKDCLKFFNENRQCFNYSEKTCQDRLIRKDKETGKLIYIEETNTYNKYTQAGYDFWLTRNGHGCGFWSRDELNKETKDLLTQKAKEFKEQYLYIGDDNKIYC